MRTRRIEQHTSNELILKWAHAYNRYFNVAIWSRNQQSKILLTSRLGIVPQINALSKSPSSKPMWRHCGHIKVILHCKHTWLILSDLFGGQLSILELWNIVPIELVYHQPVMTTYKHLMKGLTSIHKDRIMFYNPSLMRYIIIIMGGFMWLMYEAALMSEVAIDIFLMKWR